jgi:hypothetical protein
MKGRVLPSLQVRCGYVRSLERTYKQLRRFVHWINTGVCLQTQNARNCSVSFESGSDFESAPRAPHSGTQIANAVSAMGFEALGPRAQRGALAVADTAIICYCRKPETAPAAAAAAQRWLACLYTCQSTTYLSLYQDSMQAS